MSRFFLIQTYQRNINKQKTQTIFFRSIYDNKANVKQSLYRPGQVLRVPGG
jgi:hypothetical protein